MKKIILVAIAGVMLLSNIAIASAKTLNTNINGKVESSPIHVDNLDPHA
ncbi:hypothetical protein [Clostridium saccharoperbutylacetonicum]